jgi:hypothetical protein
VSKDRHATYVTVQLRSADDQERVLQLRTIQDRFRADCRTVRFGGTTAMTARTAGPRTGRWHRVAHAVMRRPLRDTAGIVVVLAALGLPFLGVNWARPGDWGCRRAPTRGSSHRKWRHGSPPTRARS